MLLLHELRDDFLFVRDVAAGYLRGGKGGVLLPDCRPYLFDVVFIIRLRPCGGGTGCVFGDSPRRPVLNAIGEYVNILLHVL